MEENKKRPQTPEEAARAAQAEAMMAALKQAQTMYGSVPGLQDMDVMKMYEKLMQDSASMFPGVAEARAEQVKMMEEASAQDPEAVKRAYEQNLAFAQEMMQQTAGNDFVPEEFDFDFDEGWEIIRKGDDSLTDEQKRLLAYGAPIYLYNGDNVDSLENTADTDTLREMLEEWWDVTDGESARETIAWLLNEGQHEDADRALATIFRRGLDGITDMERADTESKIGDAITIIEFATENHILPIGEIPQTVLGWDLVRAVNIARWAFQCGYIPEEEMWNVIETTAEAARSTFDSWEAYGNSFAIGRGVWRGDTDDFETADEVVRTLLQEEDSPWNEFKW